MTSTTGSDDTITSPFAAISLNSPLCRPALKNEIDEEKVASKAAVTHVQSRPQRKPFSSIPVTPRAARTAGRYYFFGWPVSFKRLIELAEKSGYPPQQYPNEYTMVDGLRYVKRVSGYKWAHPTLAVVEPGCEEYALPTEAPFPGEKMMYMITVFTNSRALADRRPTVKQMQRLFEIFDDREPKWYKDASPREDFSLYCM